MEASKMHVMLDIKDRFKAIGSDTNDIAELVHKDSTVVAKQFSEKNGSQTLLTAYGYAEAAGGRVCFMTDEEWDRLHSLEQEIHDLKDELSDRDRRLSTANESISTMTREIESQNRIIVRLEKNIEDKEDSIRRKEQVISGKDAMISELLRNAGVIK